MRIVRTKTLGQDITDPGHFKHGANWPASDDTGTSRSRFQQHLSGTEFAHNVKGNGAFLKGNFDQVFFRLFHPFADSFGHFLGLAMAVADMALSVTYHHEGGKTETTTTFNNLGASIDMHYPVVQL
jgi:hypothetical protein